MLLQHIENICFFFVSVNIVIKLFAKFKKKKKYIVINYWEYLVPNIVINYVITTYGNICLFFVSVNCGGGFCSWPPASLFVRFGEPSPHSFVLKRHGKTLSAVPHRQENRPTHAL